MPSRAAVPQAPRAFVAKRMLAAPGDAAFLDDAAIIVQGDDVLDAGPRRAVLRDFSGDIVDLGEATLVPGLINAHNHLELSHVKGLPPEGLGFTPWLKWLIDQPLWGLDQESVDQALVHMRETGTTFCADIGSRNPGMAAKAAAKAKVGVLHQIEFFGYAAPKDGVLAWPRVADQVPPESMAAAGHALYSTHPETLALAKAWDNARNLPFSIHLAEHLGEHELLASGAGDFAEVLKGPVLPRDYEPPGCTPVRRAFDLGLLDAGTLAVHCVRLDDRDLRILAESGAAVCLCPRSNAFIGVGRAPWRRFRDLGVPLCLGTDSPASNHDLDLWNEIRFLLEHDSGLSLGQCLAAATTTPARVLGLAKRGRLSPGQRGGFTTLPPDLHGLPLD